MTTGHAKNRARSTITFCRVVGGALLLLALVVPIYSCGPWPGTASSRPATLHLPIDDFVNAADNFGKWVLFASDNSSALGRNALTNTLQALETTLGLWTANLAIGLCALLWRPMQRSPARWVAALIVALHALRWPFTILLYTVRRGLEGEPLPAFSEWFTEGAAAPSWTATLAPVLTAQGIFLLWRAGGRAAAPLLLLWSLWVLCVLHLSVSLSDWPGLWIAPLKGDFGSIGLPIIWLGAVLVGVAALLKIVLDAPSIGSAFAMVLWGRLPLEPDERRCKQCDYSLIGLTSERCPECGTPIATDAAPSSTRSA